ncbi:MAG: hypothetical protein HYX69_00835 [Planctomycetia bacterium]|nr:hypothetical protein [Planctomycetia bacterium]
MRLASAATLATLTALFLAQTAPAFELGVLGDSLSDEYAEASYGAYAKNWVQQLAIYGGVNVGPTAAAAGQPGGTWGEPRRTGYEYNWARAGDTSATLLSHGQHTSLAGQVPTKGIDYAVLLIGANDFNPTSSTAYANIYNGVWSQAQIDSYVSGVANNVATALNTVLPTGVKTVLVSSPDYDVLPNVRAATNATQRERVTTAIRQLNVQLTGLAKADSIPYVDLFGAAEKIFGDNFNQNTIFKIGNVDIQLLQSDTSTGTNPTAAVVHDGVHPNTTLQGLLSNMFMTGLNVGYAAGAPIFTEAEILAHRGLAYGGIDTVAGQLGSLNSYITNYALPGDGNADGIVDISDVQAVAAHYLTNTHIGDANFDGFVDISDVQAIAANWLQTPGSGAGTTAAVPEPSGIVLAIAAAALGGCGGAIRRLRRK